MAGGHLLLTLLLGWLSGGNSAKEGNLWPLWEDYRQHFVLSQGRVIDPSRNDTTTSEAQAYAMFFSLVAGDRAQFDLLLAWSNENLGRSQLGKNLPAWKWGRKASGEWGVLDDNSASDADLWMAYDLLEAARLWREPRYAQRAEQLLKAIIEQEVKQLPRLGKMLLPAPRGFQLNTGIWRLNPSYLPIFLLRRLAQGNPGTIWAKIEDSTMAMLRAVCRGGLVPDWVAYDEKTGFIDDPVGGAVSSYESIRVYLWVGMLSSADPRKAELMRLVDGPFQLWRGTERVLERLNLGMATIDGRDGPPGFYAALLPLAKSIGGDDELVRLRTVLNARRAADRQKSLPAYYDQNLSLFAEGLVDGWYKIDEAGRLEPRWAK